MVVLLAGPLCLWEGWCWHVCFVSAVNRHLLTSSLGTVSWTGIMVEKPLLSLGFPKFTQEAQTHTGRTHAKMFSIWVRRNRIDGNPGKSACRDIDRPWF